MYPDRLLYRGPRKLKVNLKLLLLWREFGKSKLKIAWKQGRMITREAAIIVTLNSTTITRWVGIMSPERMLSVEVHDITLYIQQDKLTSEIFLDVG
jgi:hypothetical protein